MVWFAKGQDNLSSCLETLRYMRHIDEMIELWLECSPSAYLTVGVIADRPIIGRYGVNPMNAVVSHE